MPPAGTSPITTTESPVKRNDSSSARRTRLVPSHLTDAIRDVVAGETLIAPTITRRLIEEFCRRPSSDHARHAELVDLTPRELEVLTLIGQGMSNREIASALVVADTTVKTHVSRILNKLGLRDRAQAVVVAYETGLVQPGSS